MRLTFSRVTIPYPIGSSAMVTNGGFRKIQKAIFSLWVWPDSIFMFIPAHHIVIAKASAYGDYKKDGKDKILQTIEMFRAIVGSMVNGEKADAA